MEKLTFKDIAKYLPYGLSVLNTMAVSTKDIPPIKIVGWDVRGSSLKMAFGIFIGIEETKPILRPLSQLVEEIEHDGKKFVPMVELAKMINYEFTNGYKRLDYYNSQAIHEESVEFGLDYDYSGVSFYLIKGTNGGGDYLQVENQEALFQKLYEWHFWTGDQSYFEKGLLIEKK